jgi:hypothetical protein
MSIETNTCPTPSASEFRQLVSETREQIAAVKKANPTMSEAEATNWAIEGMAEGWELSTAAERALRAALEPTIACYPNGERVPGHDPRNVPADLFAAMGELYQRLADLEALATDAWEQHEKLAGFFDVDAYLDRQAVRQ